MSNRKSDQQTARDSEELVRIHLESTPISKLPKNNLGKLNRTRIIKSLKLNKCAKDNTVIKDIFIDFDGRLDRCAAAPDDAPQLPNKTFCGGTVDITMKSGERKSFENRIRELERLLDGSRKELLGERWFLATGKQIRR